MDRKDKFYVYLGGIWMFVESCWKCPIDREKIFLCVAQTECTSAFSEDGSFMPDLLIGSVTKKLKLKSCSSDCLSLASF